MSNVVAPCPVGDPAALVVVLEAGITPSKLLLALEAQASVLQLAQVASVHDQAALGVVASLVEVVEEGLEAIEEVVASAEALEVAAGVIAVEDLEEIVVALEVIAVALDFSLTDTDLQMAPQPDLAVPAILAEVVIEAVIVAEEVVTGTGAIDATLAAKGPVVPTTSPWAAEIDTAIAMVGMAAETILAQGSVATKATATTIPDSAAGTKLERYGLSKGYVPFRLVI